MGRMKELALIVENRVEQDRRMREYDRITPVVADCAMCQTLAQMVIFNGGTFDLEEIVCKSCGRGIE